MEMERPLEWENGVFSMRLRVSGARLRPSYIGAFTKVAWFDSTKSMAPHTVGPYGRGRMLPPYGCSLNSLARLLARRSDPDFLGT